VPEYIGIDDMMLGNLSSSIDGIEKYLGSRMIRGIGPV